MKGTSVGSSPLLLGIDGGGTRTVAILSTLGGKLLKRIETGPSNLKLLGASELERNLREIAAQIPPPSAVAIGLAGNWSDQDSKRICAAAGKTWPGVPCHASNDLETALAAANDIPSRNANVVLVISGTGSCCFGKNSSGQAIKVGSGGHVIADTGSGFHLSVEALRGVFAKFEETGRWPQLGGRLLRALQFNEPDDLISWVNTAGKTEISKLAPEVVNAWETGDKIAKQTVERAARQLARQAMICARRLGYGRRRLCFVLGGSMLLKQQAFQKIVASQLRCFCPGCAVMPLQKESAWGAVELARQLCTEPRSSTETGPALSPQPIPKMEGLSTTEERNPRSRDLDRLSIGGTIDLMLSEDARIPGTLLACRKEIESAIRMIVQSLRRGGRLLYVGAGTSGRLGVLDASECPPTFRTPPDQVQGILAGGMPALWQSLEGEEDDFDGGARTLAARSLRPNDIVVGIAASGTTPFVWGAFAHARKVRAATVLIHFNSRLKIPDAYRPAVVINPDTGPEVLTGSTRLKAGTATKLLLNMLSTITMVRLGKVRSNLMVDVNPSNLKLKDRAVRIVCDLTGCRPDAARAALERSRWEIKRALDIAPASKQK